MKIPDLLKFVFGLVFFWFSSTILANNISKSDQQPTDVACRYEMTVIPHDKSIAPLSTAWFFWRKPDMIQTLDADGDNGELWAQTANGSIQYRKLYHADKTAVEFMPADNPTNNMRFDWIRLSSMLSQQELDALKPVKTTKVMGRSAELRKGKTEGQAMEVLWLTDERLPAKIIRTTKTGTVKLRLVEIEPLSTAHRKPIATEDIANYRQIDAADFGDMENDPFVKKVMAAQGHHDHH
jgi:hypothetical protein